MPNSRWHPAAGRTRGLQPSPACKPQGLQGSRVHIPYWMGSRPISLDIGRICSIWVSPKDEPNTSKTSPISSDIGWLPIQ